MIEITVNGEPQSAPEGQTILGLLHQLELDPARVAVELDRRIVKQPSWQETVLQAGAQLEIVQFVGGG
jgi:sulfur carrier protein